MSKKNKSTTRPAFKCSCGSYWIYHEPVCLLCGKLGIPQNEQGEKVLRKWHLKAIRSDDDE